MSECLTSTVQSYFIGANTSSGFLNCAEKRLHELNKLYIIKGGPGTGKSTLMKEISARASLLGYSVEQYYCSSDPASLDAIVIKELSVGVADGTPPHVIEPTCVGIKEEFIDVTRFWNSDFLNELRSKILELSSKKSENYSSAYRYLKAASVIRTEEEAKLALCFNQEKAQKAIKRLMSHIKNGHGFIVDTKQISSIGMNGKSKLDTFEALSDTVYTVLDKRGASSLIFDLVLDEAKKKELKAQVSYDPLMRLEAVFFPEVKTLFTIYPSGKAINTERFIIKEKYFSIKHKLRFLKYLKDEIITSAEMELKEAKKHHFSLESIYSEAMDYVSLNDMTEEKIKEILSKFPKQT